MRMPSYRRRAHCYHVAALGDERRGCRMAGLMRASRGRKPLA